MKRILAIALIMSIVLIFTGCRKTPSDNESNISEITDVSSEIEKNEIPKDNNSITASSQPEETSSTTSSSKPNTSSNESNTNSAPSNNSTNDTGVTTFEEGKKQIEQRALEYLTEHNIDPATAGETGEICHCGKKIWNPDKYGFCIPGYPNDYENSGYCTGACGIQIG